MNITFSTFIGEYDEVPVWVEARVTPPEKRGAGASYYRDPPDQGEVEILSVTEEGVERAISWDSLTESEQDWLMACAADEAQKASNV